MWNPKPVSLRGSQSNSQGASGAQASTLWLQGLHHTTSKVIFKKEQVHGPACKCHVTLSLLRLAAWEAERRGLATCGESDEMGLWIGSCFLPHARSEGFPAQWQSARPLALSPGGSSWPSRVELVEQTDLPSDLYGYMTFSPIWLWIS